MVKSGKSSAEREVRKVELPSVLVTIAAIIRDDERITFEHSPRRVRDVDTQFNGEIHRRQQCRLAAHRPDCCRIETRPTCSIGSKIAISRFDTADMRMDLLAVANAVDRDGEFQGVVAVTQPFARLRRRVARPMPTTPICAPALSQGPTASSAAGLAADPQRSSRPGFRKMRSSGAIVKPGQLLSSEVAAIADYVEKPSILEPGRITDGSRRTARNLRACARPLTEVELRVDQATHHRRVSCAMSRVDVIVRNRAIILKNRNQ